MNAPHSYTYLLPPEKIAQRPVLPYHAAKMLVVNRATQTLSEKTFFDLPEFLMKKDLLIFNDTKVIPARFFGTLKRVGVEDREVELVLIKKVGERKWHVKGKPLKTFKIGATIHSGEVVFTILERSTLELVLVECNVDDAALFNSGIMPIPPYIRKGHADAQDIIDYQTIFAQKEGSIAAPTASLHFTPELMSSLEKNGVQYTTLTLHVGSSSISELPSNAPPSAETYRFDPELVARCLEVKKNGGKVIAVGTTVVRALESMAREIPSGETALFITPPFEFKLCDLVITNFHQPNTTHLLLVESFIGKELLAQSYTHALTHNFRFLSYGDGMLLL